MHGIGPCFWLASFMVLPCLRFRFPLPFFGAFTFFGMVDIWHFWQDNSTELMGDVKIPTAQPLKTTGKYL